MRTKIIAATATITILTLLYICYSFMSDNEEAVRNTEFVGPPVPDRHFEELAESEETHLPFFRETVTPHDLEVTLLDIEVRCLALNIYFEARGSSLVNKVAVSDVVLNRVEDARYPNTVCEVVRQARFSQQDTSILNKIIKVNECQFSWFCDGKSDKPTNVKSWVNAQQLAYSILYNNEYRGITEGATHFHATHASPKWADDLLYLSRIENHKFYKYH